MLPGIQALLIIWLALTLRGLQEAELPSPLARQPCPGADSWHMLALNMLQICKSNGSVELP